ncbi:anhydro-N-acetylmuramic acid kinase [Deinococcus oregonensis]|uniref:Anhydro-N-acetylmuramic acid kinase n=1 Tax=Deinococcus oregonensis TaxID=1805970 RepID=A0ABV6AVI1_9DEIO
MTAFPPRVLAPRVLGLMSGTSADGIDAVLTEFPGWPALGWSALGSSGRGRGGPPPLAPTSTEAAAGTVRVLEHRFTPFSDELRAAVLAAGRDEMHTSDLAQLQFWLGEVLAEAAAELSDRADLIASHGQTVMHIPRLDAGRGWARRATLQLGEAAVIAERTGKPVVSDFRPADLAAGGQAAPLVPFADRIMFAQAGVRRAIHNLGGISNLTYLPGVGEEVLAFDTGPANALIDEAAALAGLRYDEGGHLAASGQPDHALIDRWLQDPELVTPPPKSTGREYWTLAHLPGASALSVPDLAATVTAFSVQAIAQSYARFVLPRGLDEIVVAGGGAFNPVFMAQFRAALAPLPVLTFEDKGWNSAAREAAAFAVLGYYAAQGWPNTLPQTTGARHAVIAGKLSLPPR